MISLRRTWMSFAWCKSATTTPRTSALKWPRSTGCERIMAVHWSSEPVKHWNATDSLRPESRRRIRQPSGWPLPRGSWRLHAS
ncbi:hypothetical protein CI102_5903 [Trichoderma harzianum]|uniref:Uncharacterized protein n=1 Tax=Trichoderma harzianum CBS 226.95 TaxID=983964 RepID=A0A2T4A9F3_TRIHA|nr:hypothetical protein M431DRAFT_443285 [Trichoderma harzianum CBS 226.95]PKK50743.1 hypothetical protein CI102_5903 [Trichoderma harzianum]PTB53719.1 hypothetical protein M431DRAFT_443285 [Trichoderma harzianum CBS 226.95]